MPTPQVQNDPVYTLPYLYKYGMLISNDATTPNTVLNIASGQCRDSNDNIDIPLGSAPINGSTTTAPLSLNAAVNGANGLDTGSLAASKMYAVYMIADSRYYQPVACILTLASNSSPLLPFGYDSYRLIGYWPTDASSHFLKGYTSGSGNTVQFLYDTPYATSVTAGNQTGYTQVNLLNIVPPVENTFTLVQGILTPGAAGRILYLSAGSGNGDAVKIYGQVTSVVVAQVNPVFSKIVSSIPTISYKVSNSGDAAAINIYGFTYSV